MCLRPMRESFVSGGEVGGGGTTSQDLNYGKSSMHDFSDAEGGDLWKKLFANQRHSFNQKIEWEGEKVGAK
jgi:hypothetical protein